MPNTETAADPIHSAHAFGLASAAPRAPYRHLKLCGMALKPLDICIKAIKGLLPTGGSPFFVCLHFSFLRRSSTAAPANAPAVRQAHAAAPKAASPVCGAAAAVPGRAAFSSAAPCPSAFCPPL